MPRRRDRTSVLAVGVLAVLLALIAPAAAGAKPATATEPPITVRTSLLSAAFHCHSALHKAAKEPILLVTGTGVTGEQTYAFGKGAFDALGHPVCDVNFPNDETADIQVSVQYLVYAIRRESRESGRQIAIFAISQGGLLARVALTYWTDLRSQVTDVVAAAGTMHGTTLIHCSATRPCAPAVWQQKAGSHLITALDAHAPRAPGPTAWTTVRSSTDDVVQPQIGRHPASALAGASNILIQRVCPGRTDSHLGTAVDSVTFAAFVDAITHPGPAKRSRLPKDVCSGPYAPGLGVAATNTLLSAASTLTTTQTAMQPTVKAEPKLRSYFRR